jgi:hypothetical protein
MTFPSKKQLAALLAVVLTSSCSNGFMTTPRTGSRVTWQRSYSEKTHSEQHRLSSNTSLKFSEEEAAAGEKEEQGLFGKLRFGELSSAVAMQTQEALTPFARLIDDVTGGWALSYADLSPETESTPVGQAFLATNIGYAVVGVLLSINGDLFLGGLTEVASIASFIYHYTQLQASMDPMKDSSVRLALMIDYICACTAILVGLVYLATAHELPPVEGIVSGTAGIGCLLLCWVWEFGLPYIVLHSFWHLFSAYTAFIVGNAHIGL